MFPTSKLWSWSQKRVSFTLPVELTFWSDLPNGSENSGDKMLEERVEEVDVLWLGKGMLELRVLGIQD